MSAWPSSQAPSIAMKKLFSLAGLAVAALAAGAPLQHAAAQDATLALPTVSLIFVPAYVAEEKGYWKSRGLNIKTMVIAGPGATNALLSGSADFSSTGPGPMFRAVAKGQKLQAIASTGDRFMLEIVLRGDVAAKLGVKPDADIESRARALKGLSFAVDSVNGYPHGYLRYIAARSGLNAEKDLVVSPMQPPSMLAALESKRVDAMAFGQPWTTQAMKQAGAVRWISNMAGDLPELNPFAYNLFVVRGDYCEKSAAICEKFVAGIKDALSFIQDHPAEALDIAKRRAAPQMEPQIVSDAWELLRPMLPRTPVISPASLKNAENFSVTAGLLDEKDRVKDWTALYTNRYAK